MNIYRNVADCLAYLFFIILAPLVQCFLLWLGGESDFYITAFLMLGGLTYDALGRIHTKDATPRKLLIISLCLASAYLLGVVVYSYIEMSWLGESLPDYFPMFFLPIIFPIGVVIASLVDHIITWRSNRENRKTAKELKK